MWFFRLVLLCACSLVRSYAQTSEAIKTYKAGVAYFKQGKLKEADSLFTLSLAHEPNVDAFYNKAVVNKKLGNESCYCTNLLYAREHLDPESSKLFLSECISVDSFYVSKDYKSADKENYYYKLRLDRLEFDSGFYLLNVLSRYFFDCLYIEQHLLI